jgi:hypothetical protein
MNQLIIKCLGISKTYWNYTVRPEPENTIAALKELTL